MSKKVRLGIIGLGQQGGAYAKFITDGMVPNMMIGAICDTDPAKKELASSTYPDAPSMTTTSPCSKAATLTPL
ncbi:oxidoreductase domain protein [Arthrobacter sp. Hiyo4]|nr:oxidoreductase domain protein [Arthrobacter sp. Hiyo4]